MKQTTKHIMILLFMFSLVSVYASACWAMEKRGPYEVYYAYISTERSRT